MGQSHFLPPSQRDLADIMLMSFAILGAFVAGPLVFSPCMIGSLASAVARPSL